MSLCYYDAILKGYDCSRYKYFVSSGKGLDNLFIIIPRMLLLNEYEERDLSRLPRWYAYLTRCLRGVMYLLTQ